MFNRTLGCALCLLLCLAAPAAWAKCSFKQGYMKSVYKVELPADLDFPQDLAPGRMLYSSAWQNATGVRIACNASGRVSGRVAGHIGPLLEVPGWYNGGVHSTNVPGVGVAVYWCNRGNNCEPSLPVTSLDWEVGPWDYDPENNWLVLLVKTGPIASGVHDFLGTATVRYDNLDVGELSIHGRLKVTARGCRLDPASSTQTIRLPTVPVDAFQEGGVLPDPWLGRPFDLRMECDPDICLSYRIDPLYPSNFPDVLANRQGDGLARNVGIQLFRELGGKSVVLPLRMTVFEGWTQGGAQRISLFARYYQTGARVTPGALNTAATFSMIYE